MFQISADTIAGLVVGFALGVIACHIYDKLMYEVVEEDDGTREKKPEHKATEPEGEPRTFGRSCQKFSSAMNIDSPDKSHYLNQVSGYCNLFNRSIFVLGGRHERCAECKNEYPTSGG